MSRCDPDREALAAVLAALLMQAAGAPVNAADLRRVLEELGMEGLDPWVLECVARLAGQAATQTPRPGCEGPKSREPVASGSAAAPQALGAPSAARRDGALYLYAIGRGPARLPEGCTGLDGCPVKLVRAGEWFAVVHECAPCPYASRDRAVVERWLREHQGLLERVLELCPDLIPVAFDTIIGGDGEDPAQALQAWIQAHSPLLGEILQRIGGCREYGVQLLREGETARQAILQSCGELQPLRDRLEHAPAATAYLLRRELERQLEERLEADGRRRAAELESLLQAACAAVRAERLREMADGTEMVGNFSCLVPVDRVEGLLERLNGCNEDGYRIRLTGPWPPYSFVNLPAGRPEGR